MLANEHEFDWSDFLHFLQTYDLAASVIRTPESRGAHASDQPARNAPVPTALRNLLWRRLLDSLGPGGVLNRTLEWSLLLNQIPKEIGGGAEGLKNRTLLEWDKIRGHIDAGRPWPIGLVMTNRDVWDQHQILVYGYENTGVQTMGNFSFMRTTFRPNSESRHTEK